MAACAASGSVADCSVSSRLLGPVHRLVGARDQVVDVGRARHGPAGCGEASPTLAVTVPDRSMLCRIRSARSVAAATGRLVATTNSSPPHPGDQLRVRTCLGDDASDPA